MPEWSLTFDDWAPEREPLREVLCALGNGYIVTRGAVAERPAGGAHYPGTYLAGGYDRLESNVAGRVLSHEELVNWPDWLPLTFRPASGSWLDTDTWTVVDQRCVLDLQRGILVRRLRVRDPEGRVTAMRSRRMVHMERPHIAAIEWEITPENWSGEMVIRSALDGTVSNRGAERYSDLSAQHLVPLISRCSDDGILQLLVRSSQSHLRMAQAARTTAFADGRELRVERRPLELRGYAVDEFRLTSGAGRTVRVEKTVAIFTSRDSAVSEPLAEAVSLARRSPQFAEHLRTHVLAWKRLWHRCDIRIACDPPDGITTWSQPAPALDSPSPTPPTPTIQPTIQATLRLHLFHLLQTVSPHSIELDVGVPARGWHGEAYHGQVFWDELFIFPFLNLRMPEISRSLLMYRVRRLEEARRMAEAEGSEGARFPWQSGSNGSEESDGWRLSGRTGSWSPDRSHLQAHVSSAVAYNIWQYYQATADFEFLSLYGAELLLEIARYWASRATLDEEDGRYHLRGVVGPDAFHQGYPWSDGDGVDDNAYTNVLAAWVLHRADDVLALLPDYRRAELCDQLELTASELAGWREVSRLMYVPFHDGVLSQFAGYERLDELDLAPYRERHGDLSNLDHILADEGHSTARYRLSRQADVLMLLYLFTGDELTALLAQMGYDFGEVDIRRTVSYYLERTIHGSALSEMVHAWVLARNDSERSWPAFLEALMRDVRGVPESSTGEGIHLGAMAGTVDIIQRGYLGVSLRDDALRLDPRLPEPLEEVRVSLRYRGLWLDIHATHHTLELTTRAAPEGREVKVAVRDAVERLSAGETRSWTLDRAAPAPEQVGAHLPSRDAHPRSAT